ncbi:hypothetical protein [Paraburkholderia sp.]|uniref:hypothetical protein n=1 Tax=Paraburkholderia sp. TaxID=1926495 RepID=UPI0025EDFA3E|nr:hypothetical protein [Paraburkholderia sp.]
MKSFMAWVARFWLANDRIQTAQRAAAIAARHLPRSTYRAALTVLDPASGPATRDGRRRQNRDIIGVKLLDDNGHRTASGASGTARFLKAISTHCARMQVYY